jgi:hypothetical protein
LLEAADGFGQELTVVIGLYLRALLLEFSQLHAAFRFLDPQVLQPHARTSQAHILAGFQQVEILLVTLFKDGQERSLDLLGVTNQLFCPLDQRRVTVRRRSQHHRPRERELAARADHRQAAGGIGGCGVGLKLPL